VKVSEISDEKILQAKSISDGHGWTSFSEIWKRRGKQSLE
jgi:hypothetical protein